MTFKSQKPLVTTVQDGHSDQVVTHPAFAQISASRVSGQVALYGSDFVHHNFITLRIAHSEQHRNLSRDWEFDRDEIVEVAMSEAQWATFVSALNVGGGVPCTLQSLNGEYVPAIVPEPKVNDFRKDLDRDMTAVFEAIDKAKQAFEDDKAKMSAPVRARMQATLSTIDGMLKSHVPFLKEQFDEYMEESAEKIKADVHAYAQNVITKAGLDAIASTYQEPTAIEKPKDEQP